MYSGRYALVYKRTWTHDGELDVGRAVLGAPVVDIIDPLLVVTEAVGGDANQLHIALLEVRRPT